MTLRTTVTLLCAAAGLTAVAHAQPASATFRPALVDTFSSSYSYSAKGDLNRGGATLGDVSISRFDFSVSGRMPLAQGLIFTPGLAYTHTSLDASAGIALPESVQELSLNLGLRGLINKQWAYLVGFRPGFYGDFKNLGSDSFNAPLFLSAFYVQSPDLTWIFGVTANAFNDNPIIPIVGVRWKFAPDWQLDVGFPRTGVSYTWDKTLTLRGGLSVLGGNYRITENLGVPAPGIRRLNNTYLDITEIRVGVGVDYKVTETLGLEVDLGTTALRRFDYPDRDYRLKGDNVGWLTIALNSRF